MGCVMGTAVDRDIVTALREAEAQLLRERFEAAVAGGDTAGTDNGYRNGHLRLVLRGAQRPGYCIHTREVVGV
jgi:hypothetical protein